MGDIYIPPAGLLAGQTQLYRSEIIVADASPPTLKSQGVFFEGFAALSFRIVIRSGSGTFRPKVYFWEDFFGLWIAKPNEAHANAHLILETRTFYDGIAIWIPVFTQTVAPFKLAITVKPFRSAS